VNTGNTTFKQLQATEATLVAAILDPVFRAVP
jgi:hypothetical protein